MGRANLRDVTAAVLAGGLGTRLRPVLGERPKVLAPVGGRPFLSYLLERLAAAGIERAVLCTGHRGDEVEACFGDRHAGLELVYSRESAPLGTGGALRHALAGLASESVLVVNGDSLIEADLGDLWECHRRNDAEVTMLLVEVPDARRYGTVRADDAGRVHGFEEKRAVRAAGWINAGVYLIRRERLAGIPAGRAVSLERELLPAWLSGRVYALRTRARFLDIGTPESFAEAERLLETASRRRERRWVILDRDGTLIAERHYLSDPEQVELIPGAPAALIRLRDRGVGAVVLTNQSAIGRGLFDAERLEQVHARLRGLLAAHGASVDAILVCPHTPEDRCECRKPRPGMVERARAELGLDPRRSFVVGDKDCDIELGRNVGATTLLVRTGYGAETERAGRVRADHVVRDVAEAVDVIERLLTRETEGTNDAVAR